MKTPRSTFVSAETSTGKEEAPCHERGWFVIVWNDPVNLMSYVTLVFQKVFGWKREVAEKHMLEVHNKGRSIVARENREKAEHYVHQLQSWGLTTTMEPSD